MAEQQKRKTVETLTHEEASRKTVPRAEYRSMMTCDETLKLLKAHKQTLAERFGVIDLALFGSAVRDAASAHSDIDILVAFDGPATSKRYFGVQFYLEDLLGRPVDLVTTKALRAELRPFVEREAVHA